MNNGIISKNKIYGGRQRRAARESEDYATMQDINQERKKELKNSLYVKSSESIKISTRVCVDLRLLSLLLQLLRVLDIEYSASCIHTEWVNRQDVNFEELNHRTHNVSCLNWFIKPVTNKYPSMTTKTTNDDERTSILKRLSRVSQVGIFFSVLFLL